MLRTVLEKGTLVAVVAASIYTTHKPIADALIY